METAREPQGSASTRIPAGATSIELRGRGLQQVPDQVWVSAATVQKLDLASNALKALDPGQLASCTALQVGAKPTFHRQPFWYHEASSGAYQYCQHEAASP